jgi:hypothetical protein
MRHGDLPGEETEQNEGEHAAKGMGNALLRTKIGNRLKGVFDGNDFIHDEPPR